MKANNQLVLILLLIPSIAETITANKFIITIPGSPYTLGRLTFIFVGVIGIVNNRKFYLNSNTLKGMLLIFTGALLGAFFSNRILENLSRSLGAIILLIGSIGIASLWSLKSFKKFLDIFFILNLTYWTYYVYDLTWSQGLNFIAYSKQFSENDVVNHHLVGVNASVSSIYIALRYFYSGGVLKLGGYLIILIGLINCFISESRSNSLFTILIFLIIILYSRMNFSRFLTIVIPSIGFIVILLIFLADNNESVFQRFNLSDNEYQERTTGMRLEFVYAFADAFAKNPFGQGLINAIVQNGAHEYTLIHNQYLTFALAGGVIALIGIFMWIVEFISVFRFTINKGNLDIFNYAIIFSMFTFLLTLTTIDFSGLLFFMYVSLLINQSENYLVERINYFKRISLRLNG